MDTSELRTHIPEVIAVLSRRGADFVSAEDAVQAALLKAMETWPDDPPDDQRAWLITVSWRKFLDQTRSDKSRREREASSPIDPVASSPSEFTGGPESFPGRSGTDDTLWLYFLCAHPTLNSNAAVALTLRAVAGLTTRQIAEAFLVPETTMAQRITRAKRQLVDHRLDQPGDTGRVLRVLYLMFNQGYSGEIDLSTEAIRLTRQLGALLPEPEVHGLLALMLLHHARRRSRVTPDGELIRLDQQDRSLWDVALITEGVSILQGALARDRLGEYQAQAAIAALHADAPTAEETDWVQIVEWYDELAAITDSPVVRLNRAVAVGEADGPQAGLAALNGIDPELQRYSAVAAHLYEMAGDSARAAALYAEAARRATNVPERSHLGRQAARLGRSG